MDNGDIDTKFLSKKNGARLKELRLNNSLTQGELAKATNLSQTQISNFEHGKFDNLSKSSIERVCLYFGIQYEDLLREEHHVSESTLFVCANAKCVGQQFVRIDGRVRVKPEFVKTSSPVEKLHCGRCRELLVSKCDKCHSPLSVGIFCPVCGQPYVHNLNQEMIEMTDEDIVRKNQQNREAATYNIITVGY